MTFENIPEFLAWLGTSGAIVTIISFIAERWAWFQEQSPKVRQAITMGIALLLPQITLALLEIVPATMWEQLNPYFQAILTSVAAISTLLFSEIAHAVDKRIFVK